MTAPPGIHIPSPSFRCSDTPSPSPLRSRSLKMSVVLVVQWQHILTSCGMAFGGQKQWEAGAGAPRSSEHQALSQFFPECTLHIPELADAREVKAMCLFIHLLFIYLLAVSSETVESRLVWNSLCRFGRNLTMLLPLPPKYKESRNLPPHPTSSYFYDQNAEQFL